MKLFRVISLCKILFSLKKRKSKHAIKKSHQNRLVNSGKRLEMLCSTYSDSSSTYAVLLAVFFRFDVNMPFSWGSFEISIWHKLKAFLRVASLEEKKTGLYLYITFIQEGEILT